MLMMKMNIKDVVRRMVIGTLPFYLFTFSCVSTEITCREDYRRCG